MDGKKTSSVVDLLFSRVAESPGDPLFASKTSSGSYSKTSVGEFQHSVLVIVELLKQLGIKPGDRVGIMMPVSLAWEEFHYALLACRAVVVGLSPYDTSLRLNYIARQSKLCGIVAAEPNDLSKFDKDLRNNWNFAVFLNNSSESVVEGKLKTIFWDSEVKQIQKESPLESFELPKDSDLATIIYTSGTTAEPKGISYTHGQLMVACEAISKLLLDVSQPINWRTVCWLPLANLFQRMFNFCSLSIGATIYLVPSPMMVVDELKEINPHVFIGVPRFYQKLHAGIYDQLAKRSWLVQKVVNLSLSVSSRMHSNALAKKASTVFLRSLDYFCDKFVLRELRAVMGDSLLFMYSGSAPIDSAIVKFFHAIKLPLLEAYGMSENIVPIAMNSLSEHRIGSVGKTLACNEVKLSASNEVLVRGPGMFTGYYKQESDSQRWDSDGFYLSGDFGRFDEDGFLFLEGRRSDIIKTSTGRRVSPLSIEETFAKLPFVEHAVAFGWNRKFISILISVDEKHQSLNSFINEESDLFSEWPSRELFEHLSKQFSIQAKELGPRDRPGGILVIRNGFSIIGGELTGNLKIRRKYIEEKYSHLLDRLYLDIERYNLDDALVWCVSTEELRKAYFE